VKEVNMTKTNCSQWDADDFAAYIDATVTWLRTEAADIAVDDERAAERLQALADLYAANGRREAAAFSAR
jgi:hypothetical protein